MFARQSTSLSIMRALVRVSILVSTFLVTTFLTFKIDAKLFSEFALDEFTNADSSYQPINFLGPGRFSYPLSVSVDSPHQPQQAAHSQQQPQTLPAHQQHGPHANRVQLIAEQALAASRQSTKRAGERKTCHPTKPFLCPSDEPQNGECIPIQYLCDGSSDCPAYSNSPGGYDEDPLLCTAAKRPPVEETANFLKTLLSNHGPQYIEKLFGTKMSQALTPLGGPERVAIALSVSKTVDDFGKALHLMRGDVEHLRSVLSAVQSMDGPMLKSLGIVNNSELSDMKFFLEKLLSTGFLD